MVALQSCESEQKCSQGVSAPSESDSHSWGSRLAVFGFLSATSWHILCISDGGFWRKYQRSREMVMILLVAEKYTSSTGVPEPGFGLAGVTCKMGEPQRLTLATCWDRAGHHGRSLSHPFLSGQNIKTTQMYWGNMYLGNVRCRRQPSSSARERDK